MGIYDVMERYNEIRDEIGKIYKDFEMSWCEHRHEDSRGMKRCSHINGCDVCKLKYCPM